MPPKLSILRPELFNPQDQTRNMNLNHETLFIFLQKIIMEKRNYQILNLVMMPKSQRNLTYLSNHNPKRKKLKEIHYIMVSNFSTKYHPKSES